MFLIRTEMATVKSRSSQFYLLGISKMGSKLLNGNWLFVGIDTGSVLVHNLLIFIVLPPYVQLFGVPSDQSSSSHFDLKRHLSHEGIAFLIIQLYRFIGYTGGYRS